MAICLSSFSPHTLSPPKTLPKPFHFLCFSSKSSSHSTQSKTANLSLKPSLSKTPSHDPKSSEEEIRLRDLLQKSLADLNVTSCCWHIKRLFKSGQASEADRVISVFESHNKAETMLYNSFIRALCRKYNIIPALKTLGRMRANRCKPDTVTCNILVGGLCRIGKLDLALEMVKHFKRNYEVLPDWFTCYWLLESTILRKGAKEGMKLLDKMETQGIIKAQMIKSLSYHVDVRAACKTGDVDKMVALLDDISLNGVKLDFTSYRFFLDALLGKNRFGEVDKLIGEMLVRACCMSHGQLDSVVMKLCENGLIHKAIVLLQGIVKGQWMRLGYRCCNMVIDTYIKEGRLDKAIGFVNLLIIDGCRAHKISFYNAILGGLCDRGQVRHVLEMYDKLEKLGCSLDEVSYTILMGALWNVGDYDGSVEMLSRILEKESSLCEAVYCTLIRCLCKDGMVDEAMQLQRLMVENEFKVPVWVYDMLLLGFCKVGRVNEAIDLLDEMFEIYGEINEGSIIVVLEGLAHIEIRKIAKELVLTFEGVSRMIQ